MRGQRPQETRERQGQNLRMKPEKGRTQDQEARMHPGRGRTGPIQSRPATPGSYAAPRGGNRVEMIIVDETCAIAKDGEEIFVVDVRKGGEVLARQDAESAQEGKLIRNAPLLVPTTVDVADGDEQRIKELEECGLVLRQGLDGQVRVLEVPMTLKGADATRWIKSVLESEAPIGEALGEAARSHCVATREAVERILRSDKAKAEATRKVEVDELGRQAGNE